MAQCFIVYICHIFFIHLSVDGHLGCFPVLAIVNNAAMSIDKLPTLHPKQLEKEQTKPKVSRKKEIIKLRAEINEIETKKREKINEMKC